MFTIENIRRDFPVTEQCAYMDVATQGPISRTTSAAIAPHMESRLHANDDEHHMLGVVEKLRTTYAAFINAEPDEISITKNASEGINIIANAFRWKDGDNVVICTQLEHANNVLPWLRLQKEQGVLLKVVRSDDGFFPSDAVARAIDERTRVVALSTETIVPGFITDIKPVADACKERGAFLLADGTQSVGIIDTDVKGLGLDGLAVSTVKGLVGLYGMGFLYCARAWAETLRPSYISRFSIDMGNLPESAAITADYKLKAGATRFDAGHYNFVAVAAGLAAIGQLREIGTTEIERKVKRLSFKLTEGLLEAGFPVCGGPPGSHTGSIVSVGSGQFEQGVQSDWATTLHDYFMNNNLRCALRRDHVRLSLHMYNNDDDVDLAVELAHRWMRRGTTG